MRAFGLRLIYADIQPRRLRLWSGIGTKAGPAGAAEDSFICRLMAV